MNDKVINEALAYHKARRFNHQALEPAVARVFEFRIANAEKFIQGQAASAPSMPPIHFAFNDSTDLNAFAFRHKKQYFITVNAGVLAIFVLLFNRILAEPQLLTHIGDPSQEASELPHLRNIKPDMRHLFESSKGLIKPKNEMREYFAVLLADLAFHFLMGHEIAHIKNGHVDYQATRTGVPFLAEFTQSSPQDLEKLDRQTMEMDADCTAIVQSVGSALWQVDNLSSCDPSMRGFFQRREDALFNCLYAVDALFRLFGDNPFVGTNLMNSDYPPTRLRQFICAAATLGYLEQEGQTMTDEFGVHLVHSAAVPVEDAFATITGVTLHSTPQGILDALSPNAEKHVSQLHDHWSTHLRDKLQPFAYRTLTR